MNSKAAREVFTFTIGGGWGKESPEEGLCEVAVIRGTDIPRVNAGQYDTVPIRFETSRKLKNRLLEEGDLILETAGGSSANGQYTGRTSLVTKEILEALGSCIPASFCKRLTIDKSVFDPKWVFYYMQDLYKSGRVAEYDSQSTGISNFQFESFLHGEILEYPTKNEQQTVSDVLSSLDEKIRLNTEISKTLEAIAQTIFKSWFIDFDPVHAKMRGEKPEGMDDATAALFPDSFEESELGLIPKGWEVKQVREVCETVVNGSTPLRSEANYWASADIPWFKTGELADGFLYSSSEGITESALKKTSVKLLPAGTVLMAIYAAPTVGRLGILTNEATFNQACTGMVPKPEFGSAFLYLYLRSQRNWFNSFAVGSAQQNISKAIVESAPVVSPGINVQTVFRNIAEPLFSLIKEIGSESNNLSSIRDALLPRLISGELQIPDEMLAS
jgi:type I restriction enzyme S subunit